jgi:hypothetical protein
MENEEFLNKYEEWNRQRKGFKVNRAFNSIGSNIFIECGKGSIWVSNASWRISKNGQTLVGSGDLRSDIEFNIQQLVGKKYEKLEFSSQFLDAEFYFSDKIKLKTFFDHRNENQWTLIFPDESDIGVDTHNEEAINRVNSRAKHFTLIETFKKQDINNEGLIVEKIIYDKNGQPTFCFENGEIFYFQPATWRVEKDQKYLVGYLDGDKEYLHSILSQFIGKKMISRGVSFDSMDERCDFKEGFVIKKFTCLKK